jgi:rubrerythrin
MSCTQDIFLAFSRACQNRTLYDFYAAAAKKEGYQSYSAMFAVLADHERAHAKRFFRLLEAAMHSGRLLPVPSPLPMAPIGSTIDNIRAAAASEREEHTQLYPQLAAKAEGRGDGDAALAFASIANASGEHLRQLEQALGALESSTVFGRAEPTSWLCRKCGYVHVGTEAPQKCPACLHPQGHFEALG